MPIMEIRKLGSLRKKLLQAEGASCLVCLLLGIFSVICCAGVSWAEVVKLKSGQVIEGKITEKNAQYIKVDYYGVSLPYFLDTIESIDNAPVGKSAGASSFSGKGEGVAPMPANVATEELKSYLARTEELLRAHAQISQKINDAIKAAASDAEKDKVIQDGITAMQANRDAFAGIRPLPQFASAYDKAILYLEADRMLLEGALKKDRNQIVASYRQRQTAQLAFLKEQRVALQSVGFPAKFLKGIDDQISALEQNANPKAAAPQ